jgi:hypothetical protein
MAYQMKGIHIPDWNEIKGYFTTEDVEHMKMQLGAGFDLHDCHSVRTNAQAIFDAVSKHKMPPGNPWPPEKINGFYSWWKNGAVCP